MNAINEFTNLADFDEIGRYGQAVQDYLNLQIDDERFTSIRLQQGIYGQRQPGVNMVRVKLPGGNITPPQLVAISDVLEQFAQHDVVHITTRQAIQIHYVPLGDTPAAIRRLAENGLTTREACNNTVRNMSACSMAGVCPREHVDVTRHLDAAVHHFLRNPLNQQLPRKFKISFSACESDCAQAMLHDLGVVAVNQDGKFGFKVLAAGGLGHKPREAIVVESFIEEKDLLLSMEAVITLHNKYSDRVKRAKSRIKFLVDKFGAEDFLEKYREEFARTKAALADQGYPEGEWRAGLDADVPGPGAPRRIFAQKQSGLHTFPISVPMGNLSVIQLRGIAATLEKNGLPDLRTTQDQNLVVLNVPAEQVAQLRADLATLGLREPAAGDDVVACPGTSTCRLGITSSTILAPKLNAGQSDLRIRVSGCHNGCAQPETGDIGVYGEGRRLHGKLIPHYQMYFGGNGMGGGGLAIKGPSVPAIRIESAIARVRDTYEKDRAPGESFFAWTRRHGQPYFAELLADLVLVAPEDVPAVLRDHGVEEDFRVLQLGGGECSGASQVQIGSAFFDAAHEREYRNALYFQRKYAESAKCGEAIAGLIGHGLHTLAGGKNTGEDLPTLADELKIMLPAEISSSFAALVSSFAQPPETWDATNLKQVFEDLDQWTVQAAEYCATHDRQLDLTGSLPVAPRPQEIRFYDKVAPHA